VASGADIGFYGISYPDLRHTELNRLFPFYTITVINFNFSCGVCVLFSMGQGYDGKRVAIKVE
jgi:hypothetical protein